MSKFKSLLAVLLVIALIVSVAAITTVSAEEAEDTAQTGASGITVYYKSEDGSTPYVYYWNSLPTNKETTYPGDKMTKDSTQKGGNWFKYTFSGLTKVNLMFTNGTTALSGQLSPELTRTEGTWWYKDDRWRSKNPDEGSDYEFSDLREDSIYFVITTRFYDGDKGNNVHCWDDTKANNPDSDPAWRGDFKGLIQKLDYIKALGFSAIWITPVVENASGYDYHGYHALDFTKVDPRYESDGATYEDLIEAAHEKGIKIIQDVVFNHTGNFGEATLCPEFTKDYSKDLSNLKECMVPTAQFLKSAGVSTAAQYWALPDAKQYSSRLQLMKQTEGFTDMVSYSSTANANNYYHNGYWASLNWDDYTCKYCQIAGDCVDLNTENSAVAKYTTDAYSQYIDMGVDAFRVDTVRHIPRLSLNLMYNKQLLNAAKSSGNNNFYMFGEVCCRYSEVWYRQHAGESSQFYTWAESDSKWANQWSNKTDPDSIKSNMNLTLDHWNAYDDPGKNQPTSNNAFLSSGNKYHTPDYSKSSGMGVIDFTMHWNFDYASKAFDIAKAEDQYYNDSTWNVVYVESHDYSPDNSQKTRYTGGTDAWAENMDLMFTFRGIPCLYYGGEVEFQKGAPIDVGPNAPLSTTGRAYFGDYLEGTVSATDFTKYTASGTVQTTLNSTLAKHLQKLNAIRRAVPALQKGQYSIANGNMAYVRRYTGNGVDSLACVAISGGATFNNVPNGKYIDAVTGDVINVSNGTLTVGSIGQANMRVYVCCASGFKGISGAIGPSGQSYLK